VTEQGESSQSRRRIVGPTYSPDGESLAFVAMADGGARILGLDDIQDRMWTPETGA